MSNNVSGASDYVFVVRSSEKNIPSISEKHRGKLWYKSWSTIMHHCIEEIMQSSRFCQGKSEVIKIYFLYFYIFIYFNSIAVIFLTRIILLL